jgi:hypothetical protein
MNQGKIEKKICKNDIKCGSGEEREGRMTSTSTTMVRPEGVEGGGGAWMGGLSDSDPD